MVMSRLTGTAPEIASIRFHPHRGSSGCNPVADIWEEVYGPRPVHVQPPPAVAEEMARLGLLLEDYPWWGHPATSTTYVADDKVRALCYMNGKPLGRTLDDEGWPTVEHLRHLAARQTEHRKQLAVKWTKTAVDVAKGYEYALRRWDRVTGLEEYLFDNWEPTYRENLLYAEGGLSYNVSKCRPAMSAYYGQWFATDGRSAPADDRLWAVYQSDPAVWFLREFCVRWKRPWWQLSHEPNGKVEVELGYVMRSKKEESRGQDHYKRLARGQGYSLADALASLRWRLTATDQRRALVKGMAPIPEAQSSLF